MKKKVFLVILLVLISVSAFARGENEQGLKNGNEVLFAMDSTWPPFEFVDENKRLVGFTIDLVTAIAKEAGFTAKFVSIAWDGIFAGLNNAEYDAIASSVTITEERKKNVDFSNPYFNAGQILAMRKDSVGSAKSLDDLAGKKVGAQIGTQGAFLVQDKKNIKLKTYDDLGFAVDELANGTIDGIVADSPLVSQYILKNKKYAHLFVIVGKPMTKEEYGIAVRKGSHQLLAKINKGLTAIKKNGMYEKIVSQWIK